jgi:hypothetical protein
MGSVVYYTWSLTTLYKLKRLPLRYFFNARTSSITGQRSTIFQYACPWNPRIDLRQ